MPRVDALHLRHVSRPFTAFHNGLKIIIIRAGTRIAGRMSAAYTIKLNHTSTVTSSPIGNTNPSTPTTFVSAIRILKEYYGEFEQRLFDRTEVNHSLSFNMNSCSNYCKDTNSPTRNIIEENGQTDVGISNICECSVTYQNTFTKCFILISWCQVRYA